MILVLGRIMPWTVVETEVVLTLLWMNGAAPPLFPDRSPL